MKSLQIRGHGLAGALLAETASAAGLRVSVWDNGGASASRVAAGLFTPLTGMRLAPSWAVEDAMPVLRHFYPELEKLLGLRFFYSLPTLRILTDASQAAAWNTRTQPDFVTPAIADPAFFRAPHGALRITGGGWVDIPLMLDALRDRRIARNEWRENSTANLFFDATGAAAAKHPLWCEAGWRNAHGDVLTLRIPGLPDDQILSFGNFLLPLGDERFRCGATYAWDRDDAAPSAAGRVELESALRDTLRLPYEVLAHEAGIRPVAIARTPIAGPHPDDPTQWIFNGFGSKGVLYAPWMAERVVAHLLHGQALPRETWAPRRIQRQRDRSR